MLPKWCRPLMATGHPPVSAGDRLVDAAPTVGRVLRRFLDLRSEPLGVTDDDRVRAVRRLGLLDTAAEERFDRLVALASLTLGMPIALVTLVDRDRQWFKARVGLDQQQTPRDVAFCSHAIDQDGSEPFVVEDARRDARFAGNPLVTGEPGIRFYAGQTIRDRDGHKVGTICVIDRQPRTLDETQRQVLAHLGALVEAEVQHRTERELLVELDNVVRTKGTIVNTLSEGLVVQDAFGVIVDWNPAAEHVLGLTGDQLAGRRSIDARWRAVHEDASVWPGDTHPAMIALQTGRPVATEVMGVHRPDGTLVWLRVNAQPILNHDHVVGAVTTFADITIEHEDRVLLDATWQTAPIGLVVLDAQRRIVRCNTTYATQAGRTTDELIGFDAASLLHPDDQSAVIARRQPVGTITADPVVEARVVRPDHTEITVAIHTAHLAQPEPLVVAAVVDTTEQHRARRALGQYRYLFEHANDVIVVFNRDRTIRYASPSLTRLLGIPTDQPDLVGDLRARTHPDDRPAVAAGWRHALTGAGHEQPFAARVHDHTGQWHHLEFVTVNLLHEPDMNGIVLTAHDVTERHHLTRELEHRATHDHLTGLATRALFEQELTRALARAERDGHHLAVCYLDLDRFKAVNDTHGHAAGDNILTTVAVLLATIVRKSDLAARLGGDEFALLLDPVHDSLDAHALVTRVRDTITTHQASVGVSIGVALNQPADTAHTILQRADTAQYQAKTSRTSAITVG